jgi:hypothetical protein
VDGVGWPFERKQYQTNPPRYEYVRTDLGRSVRPVLVSLTAWGNSRLAPAERSMILIDADTGEEEVRQAQISQLCAGLSSSDPACKARTCQRSAIWCAIWKTLP